MTAPAQTTPREPTGAAIHKDLYKVEKDPEAARAAEREQARVLGLGFFVFFSLVLGGLSLWLNGGLQGGRVVEVRAEGPLSTGRLAALVVGGALVGPDGQPRAVELVDAVEERGDEPDPAALRGRPKLRVRVRPADGGKAEDRLVVWGPVGAQAPARLRLPDGSAVRAWPSFAHALATAKLLGLVPIRAVISAGCVFGLVAALVPALLVPFYRFWMKWVTAPLGFVNTRIILGAVYFLMFTPMGLVFALKRAMNPATDALARAPREGSYWKRRKRPRDRRHFERLF